MKKLIAICLLSVLSYMTYLIFIVAPFVRIPIIDSVEILGEIIASSGFQIILILPFIIIYSLINYKSYLNQKRIEM